MIFQVIWQMMSYSQHKHTSMQLIKQTMQKSLVFGKRNSTSYKLNLGTTFQTPDFKSRIQRQFINFLAQGI